MIVYCRERAGVGEQRLQHVRPTVIRVYPNIRHNTTRKRTKSETINCCYLFLFINSIISYRWLIFEQQKERGVFLWTFNLHFNQIKYLSLKIPRRHDRNLREKKVQFYLDENSFTVGIRNLWISSCCYYANEKATSFSSIFPLVLTVNEIYFIYWCRDNEHLRKDWISNRKTQRTTSVFVLTNVYRAMSFLTEMMTDERTSDSLMNIVERKTIFIVSDSV